MQFDVHTNLGRGRKVIPFLLVVQANEHREAATRIVVPLMVAGEIKYPDERLNPLLRVGGSAADGGREVLMDPLRIFSIPLKDMGPKVDNLLADNVRIIASVDAAIHQGT
jgi:hypothetical protein